jgi:hypothetical protein
LSIHLVANGGKGKTVTTDTDNESLSMGNVGILHICLYLVLHDAQHTEYGKYAGYYGKYHVGDAVGNLHIGYKGNKKFRV